MGISTNSNYQLIYSISQDPLLGILIHGFVMEVGQNGQLMLKNQRVNAGNIGGFPDAITDNTERILALIDEYSPKQIAKRFATKKYNKPTDFFQKEVNSTLISKYIRPYIENRISKVLDLIKGNDIYSAIKYDPALNSLKIEKEAAKISFNIEKKTEGSLYTIKVLQNESVLKLHKNQCQLLCSDPAWLAIDNSVIHFEDLDGRKLTPFFAKEVVEIPAKQELSWYRKFVVPLMADVPVEITGLNIEEIDSPPTPLLTFHKGNKTKADFRFQYGIEKIKTTNKKSWFISFQSQGDQISIVKHFRDLAFEQKTIDDLHKHDLVLNEKLEHEFGIDAHPIEWLNANHEFLTKSHFKIQLQNFEHNYYLGNTELELQVKDKIDWFDVHVKVQFGEFLIPFSKIARLILKDIKEFKLPNGDFAVIPKEWFEKLGGISAFSEKKDGQLILKKHHAHLLEQKKNGLKLSPVKELQQIPTLPQHLASILRNYQIEGVNWLHNLREQNFGACLADDMGLGKTLQAITALVMANKTNEDSDAETVQTDLFTFAKKEVRPSLIGLPASLIHNWLSELKRFAPHLSVYTHFGNQRIYDPIFLKRHHVILTTYGMIRNDLEFLKNFDFNYIILDESHIIKNPNSKIAKAVAQLQSKSKLSLTGTPIENSLTDLWSQMHFLNSGLLGSYSFFKNAFVTAIEKNNDEVKREELRNIIAPFILRRTKEEVAKELPPLTSQTVFCEMPKEQKELYEKVKSKYRNELLANITDGGLNKSRFAILKGLMELRLIANHPKLYDSDSLDGSGKFQEAKDMLHEVLNNNHNVLIFSQFVKHLELFKSHLDKKGINYAYLTGQTRNRKAEIDKFNNQKDCNVFLISLKAGGVGLNLTKADYVFVMDPWWNPFAEKQAIDRAYRIGQDKHVFSYKFITKDSIEDKILKLQSKKTELAKDFLAARKKVIGKLEKQDVEQLFS